ncbi:MAG: sulfite exporter TauE/SafE family protein [Bacteroidetes bacterium]|nr:MAG: sulfite exporter TauE/SafE family protein [Bacteroidota bacterium]
MIYLLALVGAFVAGAINTLAGNGSAITLTILTEVLGLPGTVANGTNRVGIATQSLASSWAFYRNGRLDVRQSGRYIAFITIGAVVGIYVATIVSNEAFQQVFRFLLVVMLLVILVKPERWLRATTEARELPLWQSLPIFLSLGFYGGFIQMGMGVFFLAAMVLVAHYNIIDGNAVKAVVVALYTMVAVGVFAWQGLIDWKIGGLMAIGQTAGGYLTARFAATDPRASKWAYRILVAVVVWAILRMFGVTGWLWGLMGG